MVNIAGQRMRFTYLVQKLAKDGRVPLRVVRAGEPQAVQLPVIAERRMLLPDLRGGYPPYFIYGPLAFSRATQQFMQAVAAARLDAMMAPLFAHRVSTGYSNPAGFVLESVNGTHIRSLAHLVAVLRDLKDEYVKFRFYQRTGEHLVFRRQDILAATEEILADNGTRAQGSPELMEIWQGKGRN